MGQANNNNEDFIIESFDQVNNLDLEEGDK
ncbi:Uncharacterised protein [Metamycoplasma alkalescens]|nr:Uncharacterised protein [Metamycoplasma alkalescens]